MSMWWMLQISSSMMPERSEELPKIAQDKGIRDLARSEGFFRLIAESAAKRGMTIKEYRQSILDFDASSKFPTENCLTQDELEEVATQKFSSPRLADHAFNCKYCRPQVLLLRQRGSR